MSSSNKIVFASAGAGKTTEIVTQALSMRPQKVAITTFTLKNVDEIKHKLIELNGCVPSEITIYPWYTFVLHEMVRPYQGYVHLERVAGVHFARAPLAPTSRRRTLPDTIVTEKTKRTPIALVILLCSAISQAMGKSSAD